ncbi:protein kinase domain-containing protein [Glycomyces albidus]|uniref:non-specific serine/threonine protein kinase n=1 Tax=Glycomyces albidus TaxID=2656774 RepID=A0A6L5GGY4_9ACTN|nr:protein kinase [Glycomyces albidus]MQM28994.1 protein kinase [Glycomyces albidus]
MVRIPLVDTFRYIHEPLPIADSMLPMLGNAELVDALHDRILHSTGGAFLVTGFRGVGKSTVILRTLERLSLQSRPDEIVVPVVISVARATDIDRLLFAITRRIFERLHDEGLFERLSPEFQQSLLLAYMRTSLAFKETQSDAIERAGAISVGIGRTAKAPLASLTASAKRTRSLATEAQFLAYSETDVEHDIMRMVSLLNNSESLRPKGRARWRWPWSRSTRGRIRLVVVLDEADKLTATDSGLEMIEKILGGLKNVLTMPGAHYLLVAGPDLHDHAIKDVARGNSIYESIFGWRLYVPCTWSAVDDLLDTLIQHDDKSEHHLGHFRDYLQFKARGIPRRLLQEFNSFVVWGSDGPFICISDHDLERVVFYARLEGILRQFIEDQRAPKDSLFAIDIDIDRHRLGVYYVMDWVLRSEGEPFTPGELAAGKGRMDLDPLIQSPVNTVSKFLEHLEGQGIVESIRSANPQEALLNEQRAVRGAVYKLSASIRKVLLELAASNESERAALNISAGTLVASADAGSAGLLPVVRVLADRYEIREAIGMGGMGTVYRGYDRLLDRPVAVKALREVDYDRSSMRERIEREAHLAEQLRHPQIVRTYDVVKNPEIGTAIVMELLEGPDLDGLVYRDGPLPEPSIVAIGLRIAEALSYLKENGIARIDLKPSNIRIERDRGPVILDFGIAVKTGQDRLTDTGEVLGTLAYASPDLIKYNDPDHLVDIWALGMVLFYCAAGDTPYFSDPDPMSVIHRTLYEDIDVSVLPVSDELQSIIGKALKRDRAERYQTANEFYDELKQTEAAQVMESKTKRLR